MSARILPPDMIHQPSYNSIICSLVPLILISFIVSFGLAIDNTNALSFGNLSFSYVYPRIQDRSLFLMTYTAEPI